MSKLRELADVVKSAEARIREVGKEAVLEFLVEFFDKHPQIQGVRWHQYTPYFNDGDECVFSLHGVWVSIVDPFGAGNPFETRYPDESDPTALWRGGYERVVPADYQSAYTPLSLIQRELDGELQAIESTLKMALGDHVDVVASRTRLDTEEYEHD